MEVTNYVWYKLVYVSQRIHALLVCPIGGHYFDTEWRVCINCGKAQPDTDQERFDSLIKEALLDGEV